MQYSQEREAKAASRGVEPSRMLVDWKCPKVRSLLFRTQTISSLVFSHVFFKSQITFFQLSLLTLSLCSSSLVFQYLFIDLRGVQKERRERDRGRSIIFPSCEFCYDAFFSLHPFLCFYFSCIYFHFYLRKIQIIFFTDVDFPEMIWLLFCIEIIIFSVTCRTLSGGKNALNAAAAGLRYV